MGKPDMIWEEESGAKKLEYPRGPMGTQTYFVHIAPDGKYLGMERVLVEENFAKVKLGMTVDDVRRILGKQTEVTPYALARGPVGRNRGTSNVIQSRARYCRFDAARPRNGPFFGACQRPVFRISSAMPWMRNRDRNRYRGAEPAFHGI